MAWLSKADLLAIDDRRPVRVEVPEWGGHVYVRPLSGTQRGELEAWESENKGSIGIDGKLVALSLCDESGASLDFTEEDVDRLNDKSTVALQRVLTAIASVSRVTQASVEDAAKN